MTGPVLDVTSPGSQTSQRAVFEQRVRRASVRALGTLLDGVLASAREALDAPVLTAAARGGRSNPFTLGVVARLWQGAAETIGQEIITAGGIETRPLAPGTLFSHGTTVAERLGVTDPFVVSTLGRIESLDLPGEIHTSVMEVFTEFGQRRKISRKEIQTALQAALDPDTGRMVRDIDADGGVTTEGTNWTSRIERIARTESTAMFSYVTEREIARMNYPGKRWVSVRDSKVRHTHTEANGQAVRVGESFIVGGFALLGPGDPSAPPQERINCRCHMIGLGRKAARAAGIR